MNCFSAIQTTVFSEIFFPPKEVDIFFSYFFFSLRNCQEVLILEERFVPEDRNLSSGSHSGAGYKVGF